MCAWRVPAAAWTILSVGGGRWPAVGGGATPAWAAPSPRSPLHTAARRTSGCAKARASEYDAIRAACSRFCLRRAGRLMKFHPTSLLVATTIALGERAHPRPRGAVAPTCGRRPSLPRGRPCRLRSPQRVARVKELLHNRADGMPPCQQPQAARDRAREPSPRPESRVAAGVAARLATGQIAGKARADRARRSTPLPVPAV
eukprot:TRINITY_DN7325_c0_g1_i1.p2 TRINITY_DN7325_c0_g1~~TRINITY_DN7325_c0_g1_i1.p2  ORF type:complete len:230 (+),score=12.35 TRINITY_DN7325_c0_g1_i1:89-691(+)